MNNQLSNVCFLFPGAPPSNSERMNVLTTEQVDLMKLAITIT